jgi:hypothetical protein
MCSYDLSRFGSHATAAIANPRTSAAQIRAIARELPQVGLEDALAIVLALLDREPQSFSRAAARYPVCA